VKSERHGEDCKRDELSNGLVPLEVE